MSRRTKKNRSFGSASEHDSSLEHSSSRLYPNLSDSLACSSDNCDEDEVDVEDLDASSEIPHYGIRGRSPKMQDRRSPRLKKSVSGQSSPENPSPRKQTLRSDILRREQLHDSPSSVASDHSTYSSTTHKRVTGVEAARQSHQRQHTARMQTQHAEPSEFMNNIPHWCWPCLVLMIIIIMTFLVWPFSMGPSKTTHSASGREMIMQRFEADFEDLQKAFPSQTQRFWRVLKVATKTVMHQEYPREPAVIMLAIKPESTETTRCLTKLFADLIADAYNGKDALILNASNIDLQKGSDDVKLYIDDTFSQHLGHGSHVAVLHHVELIPGQAAMIFHGYCDNDNAPHKDAIMVFSVQLVEGTTYADDVTDAVVEDRLSEIWAHDLDIDKYTALLSRMAKSIAYVKAEAADILLEVCG